MQHARSAEGGRIVPFAAAAALFLLLAALYLSGAQSLYERIISAWGVRAFRFPFLDTDTVLSALRCLRQGVDVFATNPCDPLERVFDYSPLWLAGRVFPVTTGWIAPAGLCLAMSYLAGVRALPPGRRAVDVAAIALGAVSPAAVFAVERGNNDLVIFALAVLAARGTMRGGVWRGLGYGAALLAGFLKYYPMAMMALALQERPRRFLRILCVSLLALALFLCVWGRDLVRALQLIPQGTPFGDMFGSRNLPLVAADWFGLDRRSAGLLHLALILACFSAAALLACRRGLQSALHALSVAERQFLVLSGLLVPACFFTAQNIGYRAVLLVLALPGLTALRRLAGHAGWRAVFLAGVLAALFAMWSQAVLHWCHLLPDDLNGAAPRPSLLWLLRECAWWWIVTLLLAAALAQLVRSCTVRALWRPFGKAGASDA